MMRRYAAWVLLVAVVALATARYDAFLTPENVFNVLRQNSMLGLVAIGMTFVIVLGGVDLSVGSNVALGGFAGAVLSVHGSVAAIAGAVAITAAIGLANGFVIVKGRIAPFVVTLGTMFAARGLVLVWSGETSRKLAADAVFLRWLGRGRLAIVPVPVLVAAAAFVAAWVVLAHTRFGRHVYAVGDNDRAARLMGLDVPGVSVAVYALSGALAGFAGLMLAARLGSAQPVAGLGWELDAIAAVVIGGALLSGGQGGVWQTLGGVLGLGVIFNVLNLEGTISSYWQSVLRGGILLALIVLQNRVTAAARHP